MRAHSEKSFPLFVSLFIVIILVLIGFGGYSVYNKSNDNKDSVVIEEAKTSTAITKNLTVEMKYAVFEDSNYGFTFQYPERWDVRESDVARGSSDIMLELFEGETRVMSINNFSLGYSPPFATDELTLGTRSFTKYTFPTEHEGFVVYIDSVYLAEEGGLGAPYPIEFLVFGADAIEDAEHLISSVKY